MGTNLKAARRTEPVPRDPDPDLLPPHDETAETAALGCVLLAGLAGPEGQAQAEALLSQLSPALFYNPRNLAIFTAAVQMRMAGHAVDTFTLSGWLFEEKTFPAMKRPAITAMLSAFLDTVPSFWNFPTYLATLREKSELRWAARKSAAIAMAVQTGDPEAVRAAMDEAFDQKDKALKSNRAVLKIWRASELKKFEPPAHLRLVGDNELCMGYEGVSVVAGPGSSGKSLCVASLALGGAIGKGTWMGRKIHRRFRTLIIQAENGTTRLKNEIEAIAKNHPGVDIENHIFISSPPEGGIPFHRAEFRAAVAAAVKKFTPDLVVLDPWSQVAADDAAKDVVDKLGEIRGCFPGGDACPSLLIVAHTKKPRAGEVHRGRQLTNLVAGSVALVNTSRCTYVLLPWSDDLTDDRIYWSCPKLNDGMNYAPSVWRRRMGTFFEPDRDTDPETWGQEDEREESRTFTTTDLEAVFQSATSLTKSEAARKLVAAAGAGSYATAMRALTVGSGGYLAHLVERDGNGCVRLKE